MRFRLVFWFVTVNKKTLRVSVFVAADEGLDDDAGGGLHIRL